jgi:hypothetical protein
MSAPLLVLDGPIDGAGIPALCERVRPLLEEGHGEVVICDG